MSAIKDGGPAFPFEEKEGNGTHYYSHPGMSLRDYFAAKALPTIIECCKGDTRKDGETLTDYFARMSYDVADAMLAAREVQP